MIGVLIRFGTHVVVATAETEEAASGVALRLFASAGVDLADQEITMAVFDPLETGGFIFDMAETDPMAGWGPEGYSPSS